MKLGELLLTKGLIREQELVDALKRHYASGKKLGECLILLGVITEADMLDVLAQQQGFLFFSDYPEGAHIVTSDPSLPYDIALRKEQLLMQWQGETILVCNGVYTSLEDANYDAVGLMRTSEIRQQLSAYFRPA